MVKSYKTAWFIMLSGILLILLGILSGKSVYNQLIESQGRHGMEKVVVNLKNNIARQSQDIFTLKDIKNIKKALDGMDVTYYASVSASVSGNGRYMTAMAYGTDNSYPDFCRLHMLKGSFFIKDDKNCNAAVAVIDEQLSRKLFNSVDVIGKKINIMGRNLTITGVFNRGSSILNRLIDDGSASVYIPADILFDIGKDVSITHIEIKSLYNDTFGKNAEMVSKALQKIGKSPDDYKITDFNIKKALLKQVPDILIFITFLAVILMLIILLKWETSELIKGIMRESKSDYFFSILRKNLFQIIILSLKIMASLFLAAALWQLTKFRLYIPSEYIPSDLTDLGYYADLITQSITRSNEYRGYTASYPELITGAAQNMADITFFLGLFLGIPAFYLGLHSIEGADTLKLASICGMIMLLLLLLLAFTGFTLGLEPVANIQITGVVWIFIFISILKNLYHKPAY